MPTNGTGQMVVRALSLTEQHDKALEMLAQGRGRDWTPSRLVRHWITRSAARDLGLTLVEPSRGRPGPKPALGLRYRRATATRQLRLRLRKGAYKTRG
jgi:hypothetical protein